MTADRKHTILRNIRAMTDGPFTLVGAQDTGATRDELFALVKSGDLRRVQFGGGYFFQVVTK